ASGVRTLGDVRATTPQQLTELGVTGEQQQILAHALTEVGTAPVPATEPARRQARGGARRVGRDVGRDVVVRTTNGGRIDLDSTADVRQGSQLIADGGQLTVGAGSIVHAATLVARSRVDIGAEVRVGPGARIVDSPFSATTGVGRPAPVRIEDRAVVGANAVIMGGITVGAGAWIGAGAVLTADVAAGAIVVPENMVGNAVRARAPPKTLRFGAPRTRREALRQVRAAVGTARYRPMMRRALLAQLRHPRGVRVAWPVMVDDAVVVDLGAGGRIRLGHQVRLRHRTQLLAEGGEIAIGAFSWMRNTTISGRAGVAVGEYTQFAQGSRIDASAGPVRIGNDVWFGSNVVVRGPATIGDGTVIGAGAVVTGDVPAGTIMIAPGAAPRATGAAAPVPFTEPTPGTDPDARFEPRGHARFDIDPSAQVGAGTVLLPEGGTTTIAEHASLVGVAILAHHDVGIGPRTRVEPGTQIVTFNHNIGDIEQPIATQGVNGAPIRLGADVWIGPNAVILRGVKIGDGAVVGPGALVLKDVPAATVVIAPGAAATVIGHLGDDPATRNAQLTALVGQARAVLPSDPHQARGLLAKAHTLLDLAAPPGDVIAAQAVAEVDALAAAAAALSPALAAPDGTAILLDFDGTTAHHVADPKILRLVEKLQAARTIPGVTELLARMAGIYRTVAYSSGRPAAFLDNAVAVPGIDYYGSHGRNRKLGAGQIEVDERVAPYEAALQALIKTYDKSALRVLGVASEPQAGNWAIAWDPDSLVAVAAVREIKAAAEAAGLRIGGNPQFPVVDITAPVDTTKGDAVARVAAQEGVQVVVVAGDDKTDLNMFDAVDQALRDGAIRTGVKIAVRDPEKTPQELLDRATLVVDGPEGLRDVLAILAGGPGTGPGAGPDRPIQPRAPPDTPGWLQRLPAPSRELLAAELRRHLSAHLRVPTDGGQPDQAGVIMPLGRAPDVTGLHRQLDGPELDGDQQKVWAADLLPVRLRVPGVSSDVAELAETIVLAVQELLAGVTDGPAMGRLGDDARQRAPPLAVHYQRVPIRVPGSGRWTTAGYRRQSDVLHIYARDGHGALTAYVAGEIGPDLGYPPDQSARLGALAAAAASGVSTSLLTRADLAELDGLARTRRLGVLGDLFADPAGPEQLTPLRGPAAARVTELRAAVFERLSRMPRSGPRAAVHTLRAGWLRFGERRTELAARAARLPSARNHAWRSEESRSHRWAMWIGSSFSVGVVLTGIYSTAV
ncbi:MAG: acetyltransferase, partial [Pseudonocardia sp.]|nr:acetyltransferase [Pseudonocardia sp.]